MNHEADYLQRLRLSEPLRKPVLSTALQSLNLSPGSSGLDLACGLGLGTRLLADIIGSGGQVIGLDNNLQFVSYARSIIEGTAYEDIILYKFGDAGHLPWVDNAFDWACSIDFIGYAANHSQLPKEMIRVVKPGGNVAILAWSSQLLLPGYPHLEAVLNTTRAGLAPYSRNMQPSRHFLRAGRCLEQLGCAEIRARTFVGNINAPMSQEIKDAVWDLIKMRWEGSQQEIDPELREQYLQICNPYSSEFILNLPEYYGFLTYTLIHARVV